MSTTGGPTCTAQGKLPQLECLEQDIGNKEIDDTPCLIPQDHALASADDAALQLVTCPVPAKIGRSVEVCASYAASLEAEAALLAAEKSCDPLLNCYDATPDDTEDDLCHKDTSGGDKDGKYYCTLIGSTADVSNCPDVIQDLSLIHI